MCEQYLLNNCRDAIVELLRHIDDNKHFSINISFVDLSADDDTNLSNNFLRDPQKSVSEWDQALHRIQTNLISQSEENYTFKSNTHCRVFSLPIYPEYHRIKFPLCEDIDKFLQVTGTVVKMTAVKLLEYKRQYICLKCKYSMLVSAEYEMRNAITPPRRCGNPEGCTSTMITQLGELNPEFCKDYQEVKMQEIASKLDVGSIPNSMWVLLEDDLVESCKPGDNITVCGFIIRRQSQFIFGKKIDVEIAIAANHIQVNNNFILKCAPEMKDMFDGFWKTYADRPLEARDIILKSICPKLFGMYLVKLAVAVVLAGGSTVQNTCNTGVRTRSDSHLLLVGDPGTGKSELLKFAAKVIPRSVLTTGVGSTAAGLTVAAVKENGEWQLEGGALVMADGGICCIDEFNTMKEHDRTSIHEAMEQQTISVAKASIVCKLSAKCSILAAANPKGNISPSQPLHINIALPSPLLSRFDLILMVRDTVDENWDSQLVDHVFRSLKMSKSSKLVQDLHWTVEMQQAYYAVIKKNHPVLSEDANRILAGYYQAQRQLSSRNKARTTVRLLDSLVRLSQGHARLLYHTEVQTMDAIMAVILVEMGMTIDSSIFNLKFNSKTEFPQNSMSDYRELIGVVLTRLQLIDLLKKELKAIDRKKPPDGPGPSTGKKFFCFNDNKENDSNSNMAKENELVDKNKESTVSDLGYQSQNKSNQSASKDSCDESRSVDLNFKPQDVRSSPGSKSEGKVDESKKRKKSWTKQTKKVKIVNDLAALECIPSINDPGCKIFDSSSLNLDTDFDLNNVSSSKSNEENKSDQNNKQHKVSKSLIDLRARLSKFKYIPKEAKGRDHPSTSAQREEATTSKQSDCDIKDFDDISFTNVPCSTQQEHSEIVVQQGPVKKFNFKKILEPRVENNGTQAAAQERSIFEDTDIESLDLEI